jgi:hypothetical protein
VVHHNKKKNIQDIAHFLGRAQDDGLLYLKYLRNLPILVLVIKSV